MKLIELLEITNESTNVFVRDTEGNDLAMYDGKNSIDEIFNNCEIIDMKVSDNWLVAIIKNDIEVYYDFNIGKYYTFAQIKNEYEEIHELSVTDEEINNFIELNLFSNGGSIQIVDLVDVLEDAENGIPDARQFLFNL